MWESFHIRWKYRIGRAASLARGPAQVGTMIGHPSRSRRAVHRPKAPERRRARSEGEGPIPYGSRQTRIAAARRRASMFADYPRRGQASPLQLSNEGEDDYAL